MKKRVKIDLFELRKKIKKLNETSEKIVIFNWYDVKNK